ncbi:MAG: methionyl-tRNA formyltransferase [Rhodospirillales bacterium]|nr:methionyl-tRNA formyltransferase [Rhodospirillales bacterium]
MPLRIAFMGTPGFSLPALEALLDAGHDVCCVYTQPPRPAGRGKKEKPSPVQVFAEQRGIEVRAPQSLKPAEQAAAFRALELDAAVVVAYGLILPQALLDVPRLGCLNIHGSLLPRWRGAAPLQRAIMAGDQVTGVTIMEMEAGLDTGPMLLTEDVPIGPHTTAGDLHDQLAQLGARLIVAALEGLENGSLTPQPQPGEGVTYADKITKDDTHIDWSRPATEIDCRVRGLSPSPGAWFEIDGTRIRVLRAEPVEDMSGTPGVVLDDRLTIACGQGALRLLDVQRAGKSVTTADALLRGFPVPAGARVG